MFAPACSTSSNQPQVAKPSGAPCRAAWNAVPRAPAGESALARTLVADYALAKPPSAAAFAAARAVSREPLFAWAYTELLHDEARHATFGAKTAAWVIRRWSAGERRMLWAGALTSSANGADRPPNQEAEALGLLPGQHRLYAAALDPPAPRAARDSRDARERAVAGALNPDARPPSAPRSARLPRAQLQVKVTSSTQMS